MPVGIVEAKRQNESIPGFGFAIQIGQEIHGWFTECSGLTMEREVKAHPEGGVNDYVHQLPGRVKRSKITLKHGLAGNELWEWFRKGMYDGQVEGRNISIILYTVDLTEASRWDLVDVYPAKWSDSNFNSANNEMVVETLEFASIGSAGASVTVQRRPDQEEEQGEAGEQAIDLPALTKKVFALLKEELRIERERLG